MKQIDLHVHSSISDGTDSPTELVNLAIKKGLSAFALTDHDTVDGVDEAIAAAENTELKVIPGVELSTHFDKSEIHIVGLFLDYKNPELAHFLRVQRESRINRNIQVCQKFTEIGIPMTYEKILEIYGNVSITRAHFADYLVNNGYTGDRNEAFDRYLSPGKPCYVKRHKVDPKDAIGIIHAAGGIAILAHPILYHLGKTQMESLVSYCCENGLDGIEAIYSTYKMGDELYIKRIAKEHNLLISGGSDYHGKNKPHIQLGTGMGHLFVPYEILDNLISHQPPGR